MMPDPREVPVIEKQKVNGKLLHQLSDNERLMQDMGSKKGFDPIPPNQYLADLTDKDPVHRMVAFIRSKTIRKGHRSPFMVDEHGQPLKLQDIAAEFDWSMKHTRATWAEVKRRGFARDDKDGRIWLCGDVPLNPPPEPEEGEDGFCPKSIPTYIVEQIQQLTEIKKAALQSALPIFQSLLDRLQADIRALHCAKQRELEEQFFGQFGIELKRYKKRREGAGKEIVRISLKELPEEFGQILTDSGQNGFSILDNAKNGSGQNGYPFITTETEKETEEERGNPLSSKPIEDPKPAVAPPPPPQPSSSAIAVQDPERERAWDIWVFHMAAAGKPVSVERAPACRREFFKYPLDVQQRIVEDTILRAELQWNEEKWTPDPLDYLKSRIWAVKPIKRRTLPRQPSTRQQESDDVLRRVMERSIARDRERGGPIR